MLKYPNGRDDPLERLRRQFVALDGCEQVHMKTLLCSVVCK